MSNWTLTPQLICTGKFDEEWLTEPKKIPTVVYSLLICFLIGSLATICTHFFKRSGKKKETGPVLRARENTVDLGSLTRIGCFIMLSIIWFYSLIKYER